MKPDLPGGVLEWLKLYTMGQGESVILRCMPRVNLVVKVSFLFTKGLYNFSNQHTGKVYRWSKVDDDHSLSKEFRQYIIFVSPCDVLQGHVAVSTCRCFQLEKSSLGHFLADFDLLDPPIPFSLRL